MRRRAALLLFYILLLSVTLVANSNGQSEDSVAVEILHDSLFSNYNKALASYRNNEYNAALDELNKNLFDSLLQDIPKRLEKVLISSYYLLSAILWERGDYRGTISQLSKFLKWGEVQSEDRCYLLIKIADSYYRLGDFSNAERCVHEALNVTQKDLFDGANLQVLTAYQLLGLIYMELDKLELARDNFLYCLSYFKENGGRAMDGLQAYGNLAILYSKLKETDSSVFYYKQALVSLESFKGSDLEHRIPAYQARIHTNLSDVYLDNEEYDEAFRYSNLAYKTFSIIYEPENRTLTTTQSKLGRSLSFLGRFNEGLDHLQSALSNNKKRYGFHDEITLRCYFFLGEAFTKNGQFDMARSYYDSALMNNVKFEIEEVEVYSDMELAMSTIRNKLILEKKVNDPVAFLKSLEDSHTTLLSQVEYINSHLSNPRLDKKVRAISSIILKYYDSLNLANLNDEKLEQIWSLFELNKARKMDAQQKYLASLFDLPTDIRDKEQSLRDSLQLLVNRTRKGSNFEDSVFYVLNNKLRLLKDSIRINHSEYFKLRYGQGVVSLENLQSVLYPGAMVISYIKDESDIYAFSVTQNNAFFEYEDSLSLKGDSKAWFESMESKINDEVHSLVIMPHGSLWKSNFDLIRSPIDTSKYLIEDFPINYAYSASTHFNSSKRIIQDSDRVLAFSYANEISGPGGSIEMETLRGKELAELPGSSLEINEISQIMKGDYFYGKNASELKFKQQSKNYGILHLAVHGELSPQDPNDSRLIFYNSGDSTQDGSLHVSELYHMNLKANLAVLSACNTGAGTIKPGEGIQSLGRAFSFAGVPSLLLTRTEVSDVSTPYIMRFFYEGLSDGLRKSEALRQAKLRYLDEVAAGSTADPSYWASFYILGDDSPVVNNWITSKMMWSLLVMLVVGITALFVIRKRTALA